ncbi:MAG: hypothetical protein KF901_24055 [Myxococcales bacterium]|nr:hypothetical protein [Myxococcales bacterium]
MSEERAADASAPKRPDRASIALAALFGLVLGLGALGAGTGAVAAVDPDVWWVAAAGRAGSWLAPLTTNTFSFTAPDHPWVFHEHLAGPLYAAGLGALGTRFLAIIALVGTLAMGGLVMLAAVREPESSATAGETTSRHRAAGLLLALGWVGSVGLHGMSARVTILARLLPLAFVLLAFGARFDRRRAGLLVALSLLWANLHGSFVLGVAIVALAGFEGHARARWITAGLCALASLATPHGLALHGLVYDYLTGGAPSLDVVHTYVREFQPLGAMDPKIIWPELVAFGGVLTVALLGVRSHPPRALLVLALGALAFRNQRHLPLVLLLAVPLLRPILAAWLPAQPPRAVLTRPLFVLALAPALVLGVAALAGPPAEALGGSPLKLLEARLPAGARVYAPVALGGRLAWLGHERGVRVFADPRNDCYPADVLREAYELGRPGQDPAFITDVLTRREVSHVIELAGSDVARALGRWAFVAREGPYVLLAANEEVAHSARSAADGRSTFAAHARPHVLSRRGAASTAQRARRAPR